MDVCTGEVTLHFNLDSTRFPFCVDFGDGTIGVVTDPVVTHQFPGPGCYNVCYCYEAIPGDTIMCCEQVCIPECCVDPSFDLVQREISESCLNPEYCIENVQCQDTMTSHTWIFSDSTVFFGAIPPCHIFSNFVDTFGQVCVTHIVTCCDSTASYTACLPHNPGAYLGLPDQETRFSDTLPFTNDIVLNFIQQNMNAGYPLLIDGILIADLDASFGVGTWNMGHESVVRIEGDMENNRFFSLVGTLLQDAAEIGYLNCCPWRGLESQGLTRIHMNGAIIKDAQIALHYVPPYTQSSFPWLTLRNSQFLFNHYGIKSVNQYVGFKFFDGNTFTGTIEGEPGCIRDAVNAIDFRNVNSPFTLNFDVRGGSWNTISGYEQAFRIENAAGLRLRGFQIHSLENFFPVGGVPNNAFGDAGIGIDYRYLKSGRSTLDIDRVSFKDFEFIEQFGARSLGVRMNLTQGSHTLSAKASNPLNSITTELIAGAYDVSVDWKADLRAIIHDNLLSTSGGDYGFGLAGRFVSSDNTIDFARNQLAIASNPSASNFFSGGVVLLSESENVQDFRILDNHIVVNQTDGAGIAIHKALLSIVRRDTIVGGSSTVPGILLTQGGQGLFDCNDIRDKNNGFEVYASEENRYAANYLRANDHDMFLSGDLKGANGSLIQWNTFFGSDLESFLYQPGTITGKQHHAKYNQWNAQFGVELRHLSGNGPDILQCQFWRPGNAQQGSPNFPEADPEELFKSAPIGTPVDTVPPLFCTSAYDGIVELQDPGSNPWQAWQVIVEDTGYWSGLTDAEADFMRQEIF
ncbi:MAG: hypothetical protein D6816_07120, partial [Bacteroidetes bacterium]